MERRLHPRTRVQFEAKVTHLATPERSALGRVADISPAGISVVLPLQLATGDLVRMEMADSILTCRVVYCNPEGAESRIGFELQQIKLGTSDLSNLLQRTLMEAMPGVPELEPVETRIC